MSNKMEDLIAKANDDHLRFKKVEDFMNHTLIHMQEGDSIKKVIEILKENNLSCIAVCDNTLNVIGIVTQHDLIIQAAAGITATSKCRYQKKVMSVKETDNLKDVIILFFKNKIKQCPVIDNKEHLIGYLSRMDILSILIE